MRNSLENKTNCEPFDGLVTEVEEAMRYVLAVKVSDDGTFPEDGETVRLCEPDYSTVKVEKTTHFNNVGRDNFSRFFQNQA